MGEWHKEAPLKVVFARNMHQDEPQPNVFMQTSPGSHSKAAGSSPLTVLILISIRVLRRVL
jgi:hypothetical protein